MSSSRGSGSAQLDEGTRPSPSPTRGPVRVLCDEIGFPWDPRLERRDLFIAFVRQLVGEIDHIRFVQALVEKMGGKGPSAGSATAILRALAMLAEPTWDGLVTAAASLHDVCDELNPEDAYPTDHLIDMVSSCASAIRFGLCEHLGIGSRHAAAAAQHVWGQLYGISLFDSQTPAWEKSWARQVFTTALISLLPGAGGEAVHEGKLRDEP
jgi:hypothetical protein